MIEYGTFLKSVILGILFYIIIFASLKKSNILKDGPNAIVSAIISFILVSNNFIFSIISFTTNFFLFLLFLFLLVVIIFSFTGIETKKIFSSKVFLIIMGILIIFFIIKSFILLINSDMSEEQKSLEENITNNNQINQQENEQNIDGNGFKNWILNNLQLLGIFLFLIIFGVLIIFL